MEAVAHLPLCQAEFIFTHSFILYHDYGVIAVSIGAFHVFVSIPVILPFRFIDEITKLIFPSWLQFNEEKGTSVNK